MIQSIFTHILASMVGAVIGVFSLCIVQGGKMGDKSFDEPDDYETSFDDT